MKKNNYIFFKNVFYFSIYILILAGLIPFFSYHTQNDIFYKFFIVISNRWFVISCLLVTALLTIKFQNLSYNYLYCLRFPSLYSAKKRIVAQALYCNTKLIVLALLFLFFFTLLVAGFNTLYSFLNVVYALCNVIYLILLVNFFSIFILAMMEYCNKILCITLYAVLSFVLIFKGDFLFGLIIDDLLFVYASKCFVLILAIILFNKLYMKGN